MSHTLQHTATHCNTLQHTATHCNTRVKVLIDGNDVYGAGLDFLRAKIPGPANTRIVLGFRGAGGRFYEASLCRTAYGCEYLIYTHIHTHTHTNELYVCIHICM